MLLKDIPGYEGLYAITQDGRIFSYPKGKCGNNKHTGRWIKGFLFYGKYHTVVLNRLRLQKKISVRKLIKLTFLGENNVKN